MPLRGGRQSGVIGRTAWVASCTEDYCSVPLRYGRGCGVIGVTSRVPLWTWVLCVCSMDNGLLHESHQFIQHRETPYPPSMRCQEPALLQANTQTFRSAHTNDHQIVLCCAGFTLLGHTPSAPKQPPERPVCRCLSRSHSAVAT